MFESLASCFTFRCSALLNSPQDESAAADMTASEVLDVCQSNIDHSAPI